MPKGPFTGEQFTATLWSTIDDKAQFGNQLLRFINEGFPRSSFTKTLYGRLSQCFQHIAHCDLYGFYAAWFSTPGDQARFVVHLLRAPCFGDPAYTYSDVERAVQDEIRRRNYVARYRLQAAEAERSADMELLERLEAKYRRPSEPILYAASPTIHDQLCRSEPDVSEAPVQQMLF